MNQVVVKRWIKALRSGKYKQKRDDLARNGAYCCLGVLAVTCGKKPLKVQGTGNQEGLLSLKFIKEQGLLGLPQKKLAKINDCQDPKRDFKFIADFIEKKFVE